MNNLIFMLHQQKLKRKGKNTERSIFINEILKLLKVRIYTIVT